MCVRGAGYAIVGTDAHDVGTFDHILVPANTPHQFVNAGEEPFGFLCIVDAERDRPRALTHEELAALRASPAVSSKLRL